MIEFFFAAIGIQSSINTSLGGYLFIGHDKRAYMVRVNKGGFEFDIATKGLDSALICAKSFITTYSRFPIATENDSLIETHFPLIWGSGYRYFVMAKHESDNIVSVAAISLGGIFDELLDAY